MLLQDFNYFFNKAINQYINKRYNIYDINQQTTDDLRVLKATAMLDPVLTTEYYGDSAEADLRKYTAGGSKLFGATYEVILPDDYLHMLNCVCIYRLAKNHKCYDKDNYVQFAAKRLTADAWSIIVNDYYNRPLPERPYYYIHNVNSSVKLPTNPLDDNHPEGTDISQKYQVDPELAKVSFQTTYKYKNINAVIIGNVVYEAEDDGTAKKDTYGHLIELKDGDRQVSVSELTTITTPITPASDRVVNSNFPRIIKLGGVMADQEADVVERETAQRYGNASKVRCEIRYGHDNSVFVLEKVFIDYIKAPQTIRLTQEQVNLTEDTSQIMEFPDYVCQEIINELVTLVMENTADPRLQTHPIVTQSVANPVQQQAPQPKPQQRG